MSIPLGWYLSGNAANYIDVDLAFKPLQPGFETLNPMNRFVDILLEI